MSTQSSRLRARWSEMKGVATTMGIAAVAGFVAAIGLSAAFLAVDVAAAV